MKQPELAPTLAAAGLESYPQDKLGAYLDLLRAWNVRHNLTSVREDQRADLHLVDCLLAWQDLRSRLGTPASILDVGTGAGLPGLIFALASPSTAVSCVDAVGKKIAFVRQAASELGLSNVTAIHARVEDVHGQWPVITSRAFSSMASFVGLSGHLLAPDGCWMAMKARLPGDELNLLGSGVAVFHVEQFTLPGSGAQRSLVYLKPSSPCFT